MATVTELQAFLHQSLQDVRDGKMDTEKAKAITGLANTLVSSAKAEIEFAKVTGSVDSQFFKEEHGLTRLTNAEKTITPNGGLVKKDGPVTTHKLIN